MKIEMSARERILFHFITETAYWSVIVILEYLYGKHTKTGMIPLYSLV